MPLQLLALLFPKKLLSLMMKGVAQNTLTLLACGGVLKNKRSSADIAAFTRR
jgi:hypothetical protein